MKNYLLVSMLFCGTQTLSAQNFTDKTVGTFNILFGVNKAEIQNQYYPKLDWNLSLGRAKTVYDYLIEHGMDAKRLIFKGYGNSVMLFPIPFSDAEHAANRRVEIRVLEK
jgi:outer membrane protein OmpA-like peptidoglycan-associated protein